LYKFFSLYTPFRAHASCNTRDTAASMRLMPWMWSTVRAFARTVASSAGRLYGANASS